MTNNIEFTFVLSTRKTTKPNIFEILIFSLVYVYILFAY